MKRTLKCVASTIALHYYQSAIEGVTQRQYNDDDYLKPPEPPHADSQNRLNSQYTVSLLLCLNRIRESGEIQMYWSLMVVAVFGLPVRLLLLLSLRLVFHRLLEFARTAVRNFGECGGVSASSVLE